MKEPWEVTEEDSTLLAEIGQIYIQTEREFWTRHNTWVKSEAQQGRIIQVEASTKMPLNLALLAVAKHFYGKGLAEGKMDGCKAQLEYDKKRIHEAESLVHQREREIVEWLGSSYDLRIQIALSEWLEGREK